MHCSVTQHAALTHPPVPATPLPVEHEPCCCNGVHDAGVVDDPHLHGLGLGSQQKIRVRGGTGNEERRETKWEARLEVLL